MKNYFNITTLKSILAVIVAVITWAVNGWDMIVIVCCALMVLDYITGVICAIITTNLSSKIGYKGILKKISMFLLIVVGVLIDRLLQDGNNTARNIICFFFIGNEGVSILENLSRSGIKYPEKLKSVFEQLKKVK